MVVIRHHWLQFENLWTSDNISDVKSSMQRQIHQTLMTSFDYIILNHSGLPFNWMSAHFTAQKFSVTFNLCFCSLEQHSFTQNVLWLLTIHWEMKSKTWRKKVCWRSKENIKLNKSILRLCYICISKSHESQHNLLFFIFNFFLCLLQWSIICFFQILLFPLLTSLTLFSLL